MRVLVLGVDHSLIPRGCSVTSDPGGDFEAVVATAAHVDTLPGDVPVFVLKSGGMADWAVKQKRPDVIMIAPEDIKSELDKITPKAIVSEKSDKLSSLVVASYANKGGVGKTSSAINLALSLAAKRVKTVLVDMDFGAPDIAGFFDIKPTGGLECLKNMDVDDLLIRVKDNLWIIPGMTGPYQRELDGVPVKIKWVNSRIVYFPTSCSSITS